MTKTRKPRDYHKKIVLTCVGGEWSVKYLEGDLKPLKGGDNFISRKDLNDTRRFMLRRHRLYQREKLMQKRTEKTKIVEENAKVKVSEKAKDKNGSNVKPKVDDIGVTNG